MIGSLVVKVLAIVVLAQGPQLTAELLSLRQSDILPADEGGFVLLPSTLAMAKDVRKVFLSPSGSAVLATKQAHGEGSPESLCWWDDKSKKERQLLLAADEDLEVEWMSDSSGAFVTHLVQPAETHTDYAMRELYFVSSSGQATRLFAPSKTLFTIDPCPSGKVALIRVYGEASDGYFLAYGTRMVRLQLNAPPELDGGFDLFWGARGLAAFGHQRRARFWFYIDPQTGQMSRSSVEIERQEVNPPLFNTISRPVPGTDLEQHSLVLREDQKISWVPDRSAVICADASWSDVSASGSTAAYLHSGYLFVRKIRAVKSGELEAIREEIEKRELISVGKEVGIAVMIYLADNDDRFPLADSFNDSLHPYIKSQETLLRFEYALNGEDAVEIEDPDKKVVGYVPGKYGRAVVYADSHVIWEPKRKT